MNQIYLDFYLYLWLEGVYTNNSNLLINIILILIYILFFNNHFYFYETNFYVWHFREYIFLWILLTSALVKESKEKIEEKKII